MKRIRYVLQKNSMTIIVMISLLVFSIISLADFPGTVSSSYRAIFPLLYYHNEQMKGQELVENSGWLPSGLLSFLSGSSDGKKEKEADPDQQPEKKQNGFTARQLSSHHYLLEHVYSVDSTTSMRDSELDAPKLIKMNLRINNRGKSPKVLIYHTHTSEEYADSRPGNADDTVVGVGDRLADLLEKKYKIKVYHDKTVYDIIDGELDRSRAYTQSGRGVEAALKRYPSIQVVIDLHRDGVEEGTRLVTELDGKPTAQVMYFNGLSHTNQSGDIAYLENPYIKENLAFTLQLQNQSSMYYPGWARKIYVRGYRYNLHYRPRSLLVEVGAQTNTVEEAKNAMTPLAHVLSLVLLNKPVI